MYEKTVTRKTLYSGRILELEFQEVELPHGQLALREIIRHRGAVAVLARRSDGRFLFVKQFRKPVEQVLLEVVAGNREPNEPAEECARRELTEETGYRVRSLEHLGFIYPSPGYVDERIDIFCAETEDETEPAHPDADEMLETVTLTADEVVARILAKEIHDSKTLAAWMMYTARHRV